MRGRWQRKRLRNEKRGTKERKWKEEAKGRRE